MTQRLIMATGGLDSSLLVHMSRDEGVEFRLFYIDYGAYDSEAEIHCMKATAHEVGASFEIVDARNVTRHMLGLRFPDSLNQMELDVLDHYAKSEGRLPTGLSVSLSLGGFYAESAGIPELVVGVIKDQTVDRPQMGEYFEKWGELAGMLNPDTAGLKVLTPLIGMSKAEVVAQGAKLGVRFENTWSCIRSSVAHCGICTGCVERREAFEEAGVADPVAYAEQAAPSAS